MTDTQTQNEEPVVSTNPEDAGAAGTNPLAEAVLNVLPDVSPNPSPRPNVNLETTDLAALERRLREALARAERGTELLEEAIRKRRR